MPSLIENYGLIGDLHGAALVSREGSIDWLCMPRFDSEACMAALLGRDEHGHWMLYPSARVRRTSRRYRPGTMILETDYECDGGAVRLVDFMPFAEPQRHSVIRIVEGLEGTVPVTLNLVDAFTDPDDDARQSLPRLRALADRSTSRGRDASLGTSRRRSLTWRSSTPRACSPTRS